MRAEISSTSLPSPCFIPPLEPGYEPNLLVPHLPPCLEICKLQLFAPWICRASCLDLTSLFLLVRCRCRGGPWIRWPRSTDRDAHCRKLGQLIFDLVLPLLYLTSSASLLCACSELLGSRQQGEFTQCLFLVNNMTMLDMCFPWFGPCVIGSGPHWA
jgi:hypothetical protein